MENYTLSDIIWIFIMGGIGWLFSWFVISTLDKISEGPKALIFLEKYKKIIIFLLMIISLLSIFLLNKRLHIIPSIMLVSVVTLFIATTTHNKNFYPHSANVALAMLGIIYAPLIISLISPSDRGIGFIIGMIAWYMSFLTIVPIIILEALNSEELNILYPITLSAVLGIVMGLIIPSYYGELGMMLITIFSVGIILLNVIAMILLFNVKFKFEYANKYFVSSKSIFLALFIFFCLLEITYNFIFKPFSSLPV